MRNHLAAASAFVFLIGAATASAQTYPAADLGGKLTSSTQTDATTITVPYATNGRTRTWGYTWSTTGQLLTVDGPLAGTGDTTTYTYSPAGYLATVTDPVGHTTTVSTWNGRGQPTTVLDANGVSTTFTYDIRGRVLTTTLNPGGAQSQYSFEYDAVGNLTKLTLPGGGYLTYTYDDASRVTGVGNDRGQVQIISSNLKGDPTQVTVKTSAMGSITKQQNFAYDELGRIIQSIGAGSQTWNYAYDKVDNPTQTTDARSKVFGQGFDALNRVVSQTKPGGETVEYNYNPADKLTLSEDGRNLQTTRIVDGFGQVIQEVSPERGTRTYWYDAAGNLTKLVDGDGEETNYTYDNANRLLTAAYPGASAETITYSYDATAGGNKGMGRLTGVTEESGSTAYTYDARGRTTAETKTIQGRAYAVAYAHDDNGEVTGITLPSGRSVTFTRASDGLVSAITTKATPMSSVENLATSVTYLPFGPLESLTYGNGLALTRTYDNNYWLTRTEVKATGATRLDLTFNRNDNGQLSAVVDNASSGRAGSFGYTDAGRLSSASGAGSADAYMYDAAGNRTDLARTVGGVTTHETPILPSTSNKLLRVEDGAAATLRTLTFRTSGDLSQDAHAGGPTYAYEYNRRKRLSVVKNNSTDVGHYGYDFEGRRVWREVLGTGAVHTQYIFDSQGHLLAEHDGATGAVVREYVWLDDMPVAMIDSSSGTAQTYFIHTGQIGEPLVMTDAAKAKVWDASIEPYGKAHLFGTPTAGLDMRLPGQWLEAESGGLHQNWFRNYDPSLGRYIEADPLGIDAGQNVFAYVDGDPANLADPMGQCPWCFVAGAVVGGGLDFATQLIDNRGQLSCVDLWQVGFAALAGGVGGAVGRFAWLGKEISLGKNFRIAPFGNRTGDKFGNWPHYHRRGVDSNGNTMPGQGIGRHRPWETKSPDTSFGDRF